MTLFYNIFNNYNYNSNSLLYRYKKDNNNYNQNNFYRDKIIIIMIIKIAIKKNNEDKFYKSYTRQLILNPIIMLLKLKNKKKFSKNLIVFSFINNLYLCFNLQKVIYLLILYLNILNLYIKFFCLSLA